MAYKKSLLSGFLSIARKGASQFGRFRCCVSFSPQFVRVKMKSDKCRGYKDDHFVLCNHCLPVTVCYTFPLPESGFDREKTSQFGRFLQEKSTGNQKNLKNRSKNKNKNALKGSAKF